MLMITSIPLLEYAAILYPKQLSKCLSSKLLNLLLCAAFYVVFESDSTTFEELWFCQSDIVLQVILECVYYVQSNPFAIGFGRNSRRFCFDNTNTALLLATFFKFGFPQTENLQVEYVVAS